MLRRRKDPVRPELKRRTPSTSNLLASSNGPDIAERFTSGAPKRQERIS
jgi:hypothetical protein